VLEGVCGGRIVVRWLGEQVVPVRIDWVGYSDAPPMLLDAAWPTDGVAEDFGVGFNLPRMGNR